MKNENIILFLLISSTYSIIINYLKGGTCNNEGYTFTIVCELIDDFFFWYRSIQFIILSSNVPNLYFDCICILDENYGYGYYDRILYCTITSELNKESIKLSNFRNFLPIDFFEGYDNFEIYSVTCLFPTFTVNDISEGNCTNNTYTFKISGTLSENIISDKTIIPIFTSPAKELNSTCLLPATDTSDAVIECNITSDLYGDTITLSNMTIFRVSVIGLPVTITRPITCPPTFTASAITIGYCNNEQFRFRVSGILSEPTTSIISINSTFKDISPDYNCSIPITEEVNLGGAYIQCTITSPLYDYTIKILSMNSSNEISIKGLPVTMIGNASCGCCSEKYGRRGEKDGYQDENGNQDESGN